MSELYELIDFENLKEGQIILGFATHVLSWDSDRGKPRWGVVPVDQDNIIAKQAARIEELEQQIKDTWIDAVKNPPKKSGFYLARMLDSNGDSWIGTRYFGIEGWDLLLSTVTHYKLMPTFQEKTLSVEQPDD